MHLHNVCLVCLRHGRQNVAARLPVALQGRPALTPTSANPRTIPSISGIREYVTVRRCLSTTHKLEARKSPANKKKNTASTPTSTPKDASSASPTATSAEAPEAIEQDRRKSTAKDLKLCIAQFANTLRSDIAQRSGDDQTIGTRPLGEWDLDSRIKDAAKIPKCAYKPGKLMGRLHAFCGPLRSVDTYSALGILELFRNDGAEMPTVGRIKDAVRALREGQSLPENNATEIHVSPRAQIRMVDSKDSRVVHPAPAQTSATDDSRTKMEQLNIAKLDTDHLQTLDASETSLIPLSEGNLDVPRLSFDLPRVLFNPGVYQLQDPRSRVYNFDPYLEKVMPVTEFDFDALNEYVTSSEDDKLRDLALQNSKRYIGSSSSMTSSLAQFHFLISAWREINFKKLSKGFKTDSTNFTKLTRAPSAVFLRWRNGVYAMDADKEYDSANILMSLGKSIEKLLTLEKQDFEKYRKSARLGGEPLPQKPEQYHYGEIGNFLMRSQLDAHDPRLPGSGMFDLKTRAVAAVRMSLSDHEKGQGYEIRDLFGTWESYEREYYDMIRSAFLKYSLQVRMGRMDGIFVAFHNIERIFGFQYISLAEMDEALHGQSDPSLGDQEFGLSVKLMEDLFDRGTQKWPEQSLRIYFEVREPTEVQEPVAYMNVFVEPISEAAIESNQQRAAADIEAFEQRIFNGMSPHGDRAEANAIQESEEHHETKESDEMDSEAEAGVSGGHASSVPSGNDADVSFLESLSSLEGGQVGSPSPEKAQSPKRFNQDVASSPVIGFKVLVRNQVNGKATGRVTALDADDDWQLEYSISELPSAQAISKYRLCRARRATALRMALTRGEENDFFLAKLYRMSEAGRAWRRQRDELDAQKGRVVLYDPDS